MKVNTFQHLTRYYCEDPFKKRGQASENIYIRKETHKLLRDIRKNSEAIRYQKYKEQIEKIRKEIREEAEQEDSSDQRGSNN